MTSDNPALTVQDRPGMRLKNAGIRRTRLGVALRPLAALLLLSIVGCGGMPERPVGDNSLLQDREMFVAGYGNIESIYIDPGDPGTLTMAGLERLTVIDPAVSVKRAADSLILLVDGKAHAVFDAPAHDDGAAWGILTANVIDAARSVSSSL